MVLLGTLLIKGRSWSRLACRENRELLKVLASGRRVAPSCNLSCRLDVEQREGEAIVGGLQLLVVEEKRIAWATLL